jgi:transposase
MPKQKPWTNREVARLAEMTRAGKSVKDIAADLGRTARAVYGAMGRYSEVGSVTTRKRAAVWDRTRQEWTAEP